MTHPDAPVTTAGILARLAAARLDLDAWADHLRRRNDAEPGHDFAAERAARSALAALEAAACDTRSIARDARSAAFLATV